MPKLEGSHPAWAMVRSYIREYGGDPEIEGSIPHPTKAPLSILVAFELKRRRLSYQRAANLMIRAMPNEDPIQAAGLYHLTSEAAGYTATPKALSSLARGFDWDLDWLRAINGEDLGVGPAGEARSLAQDIAASPELAALVRVARQLTPERLVAVQAFAEHLAANLIRGEVANDTEPGIM